jgi:hypothetical protein
MTTMHALVIAASRSAKSDRLFTELLPWLLLLLAVVLIGAVVIYFIRRSIYNQSASSKAGFTLHDLRELRSAGELTDEEFERAKAQMIGRLRTVDVEKTPPISPGNKPLPPR